jgi:hypothetical protein
MRAEKAHILQWLAGACVALLLAALPNAGCGVKSAPVPPEMTKPAPITDLRASADRFGIDLSWTRPTHYLSGHSFHDLGDFVILRGEGHQPLEPLVELPVTDQERFAPQRSFSYLDGETQVGRAYRYQIVCRTLDGYASPPSNEVEFVRVRPRSSSKTENFNLPAPRPANLP